MARNNDVVWVDNVVATKETEKALLVEIEGEDHWIPKSMIHEDSEIYKSGDEGTLVIPQWLAEDRSLV